MDYGRKPKKAKKSLLDEEFINNDRHMINDKIIIIRKKGSKNEYPKKG